MSLPRVSVEKRKNPVNHDQVKSLREASSGDTGLGDREEMEKVWKLEE